MGWFLYADKEQPSGRIIGHSGSQSGTATQLFILLDKKEAVVVISNTASAWNDVFSLTHKLTDVLVRPEDINKPLKKVTTVSNKILDHYVGKYKFDSGTVVELSRKDNIFYGEIEGIGKRRIYPESDRQFIVRNMGLQLEFESSTEIAKSVTLIQNGERHVGWR